MRILMLGPAPETYGGMAELMRLYQQAWQSSEFQLRSIATYDNSGNLVAKLRVFLGALFQYCYLLIVYRPDCIHIHFSKGGSLIRKGLCLFIARLWRRPVLLHQHSSGFWAFYQEQAPSIQKLIAALLRQASALILVSPLYEADFATICPKLPIYILNNPLILPQLPPQTKKAPICLFLARLRPEKGLPELIAAVPRIVEAIPDVQILIAGDGERLPTTYPQVQYLGWVEAAAKAALLSNAKILIHPSHNEAMPFAIMEAMAYRLPIIATAVGGMKNFLRHEENALLIPLQNPEALAEAAIRLLQDESLYIRLSTAAQKSAEDWEIGATLSRLFQIYRLILGVR